MFGVYREVNHTRGGSGSSREGQNNSSNNNSAFEMYNKGPMTYGKPESGSLKPKLDTDPSILPR